MRLDLGTRETNLPFAFTSLIHENKDGNSKDVEDQSHPAIRANTYSKNAYYVSFT
jgi:hypothetical protein